ncbi:Leydig cell tumor 10 kDa protein homolog [Caenorhabditis elegans]|uniref:Leydig cell tumor 10 kDa protein homolog n=1 Tax=Caenorhabditis elegans TaxID=6239 RepID=I7J4C6_CAEEL|nr:Leydig cell tumor 10 kDa protein homolog [Caenorhabditis elegans]CCJ09389.1 Leydig cell tumor 10 kDa protein homolog [Caenorhabditis elegans]|eukprot:NP_001263769.1 Uncharacterized protein CELE_K07F5.15 [Caenorhabditis elegans]
MVQGKLKQKTALPKGVKQKVKKAKNPGQPKKGKFLHIAPKKAHIIEAEKVAAHVTKVINDKNEEMVKGRADTAVGKNKK